MWILNVKFNASTWNFLTLVMHSAIFNVTVLGFSMSVFLVKNNKDQKKNTRSPTQMDFICTRENKMNCSFFVILLWFSQ